MPSFILKNFTSKLHRDWVLCIIAIVGFIFTLSPAFHNDHQHHAPPELEDIVISDLEKNPSVLASILIVIIPFVDIMLDFCQKIWDWVNKKNLQKKQDTHATIYRLTDRERFVFIIGMILQSTISFLPTFDYDDVKIRVLYHCTRAAAQILFVTPVLLYLQRCTTTFTPIITTSILISLVIGLIMYSLHIIYRFDWSIKVAESIFMGFGVFLFFLTSIACFISYCKEKYVQQKNDKTQSIYSNLVLNKSDDYMYTHCIPAGHMIAYIIMSVAGIYIYIYIYVCLYIYMSMYINIYTYIYIYV
jgi:hypothetical protein